MKTIQDMGFRFDLKFNKGFSLIEILMVAAIIGIFAVIGIPTYNKIIKYHKLAQYAADIEYSVKYARFFALKKTTNVGICAISTTQLQIYDLANARPYYAADSCPTSSVTSLLNLSIANGDHADLNISLQGSSCGNGYPMGCFSFDSRGFVIWTGNLCVTDGRKYFRVVVDRSSIRTQEGTGGCS